MSNLMLIKKLILILLAVLLIICGVISPICKKHTEITVTNRGFWDKDNIQFNWDNKSNQEEIELLNSSFIFIEVNINTYDAQIIGLNYLIFDIGFGDAFSNYEINNTDKKIKAYGFFHELNYTTVNNTLKIVLGKKWDTTGFISVSGGCLSGYYSVPIVLPNITIMDGKHRIIRNITIKIDENYNVFVNEKILNPNESIKESNSFIYAELNLECICGVIFIIIAIMFIKTALKIKQKIYPNQKSQRR